MMKTRGRQYRGRWTSIRTGSIYRDDDNILSFFESFARSRKKQKVGLTVGTV